MMQASGPACIIIRVWFSVVEFQRQLYVPWGLGPGNLSHRGSQAHVGCIELDMVESVDEVGPELQPEPLSDWEVLMHTHVNIGVSGRTQSIELR